jgi:hypothetical protein
LIAAARKRISACARSSRDAPRSAPRGRQILPPGLPTVLAERCSCYLTGRPRRDTESERRPQTPETVSFDAKEPRSGHDRAAEQHTKTWAAGPSLRPVTPRECRRTVGAGEGSESVEDFKKYPASRASACRSGAGGMRQCRTNGAKDTRIYNHDDCSCPDEDNHQDGRSAARHHAQGSRTPRASTAAPAAVRQCHSRR